MFKPKDGYFPITSVHRSDLEAQGFDASAVDDATMFELADKMADAYLDSAFWIDLEIIAEALGIPKRADPARTPRITNKPILPCPTC